MSYIESSGAADTPAPPYYAVIFTSRRTPQDDAGYAEMAGHMEELAQAQPGYLGIESARDTTRVGITISYWRDLDSVGAWREHLEHRIAQKQGRLEWYDWYEIRIAHIERAYGFERPKTPEPAITIAAEQEFPM